MNSEFQLFHLGSAVMAIIIQIARRHKFQRIKIINFVPVLLQRFQFMAAMYFRIGLHRQNLVIIIVEVAFIRKNLLIIGMVIIKFKKHSWCQRALWVIEAIVIVALRNL